MATTLAGSLAIGFLSGFVDPGTWWCVAHDEAEELCNRSEVVELDAMDRLDFMVDEFPGLYEPETTDCILPE